MPLTIRKLRALIDEALAYDPDLTEDSYVIVRPRLPEVIPGDMYTEWSLSESLVIGKVGERYENAEPLLPGTGGPSARSVACVVRARHRRRGDEGPRLRQVAGSPEGKVGAPGPGPHGVGQGLQGQDGG